MAIWVEVALLLLTVTICRYGNHAFNVSIQTYDSLPVIGEDFTLVCTFMPEARNRRITWEDGYDIMLVSQVCWLYPECGTTVSSSSRFSLLADTFSANLTIKNLTADDTNNYKCTIISTLEAETPGSSTVQVTALLPAPPNDLFIINDEFPDGLAVHARFTVTAGVPSKITCVTRGARPPAVLEWVMPDDTTTVSGNQYDVVQGDTYSSRLVATIISSSNDTGKNITCVASHPELESTLQISTYLNARVLPTKMLLSLDGDTGDNKTEPRVIHVCEETSTTFICKSVGSFPAVQLTWSLGNNNSISGDVTFSTYPNSLDGMLYDAESRVQIYPKRTHHREFLRCFATLEDFTDNRTAMLVVYGLPDGVKMVGQETLRDGTETTASCVAFNGYPAPVIHWYIGSRNMSGNSQLQVSKTTGDRYDVNSTISFVSTRNDNGKPLLCRVVQHTTHSLMSVNASIVLDILYLPTILTFSFRRVESTSCMESLILTCISDANPPAYIFYWFLNGSLVDTDILTMNSSNIVQKRETVTQSILTVRDQYATITRSFMCVPVTDVGNGTAVIEVFPIPNSPARFIADQNYTTSTSISVTWQPCFDGGSKQTFSLQFCTYATEEQEERCGLASNLTGTSFKVTGLNSFTWYILTLWAVNDAGNSSAREIMATTAPSPPRYYGMNITLNIATGILTLSEINTNQSLEEICFFVISNTSFRADCSSTERTKCIEPGSRVDLDPGIEYQVVTSGRGLCSEAEKPTVIMVTEPKLRDSHVTGYSIAAGVLAVTVLLLSSVGVLCFVKRMKARGMAITYAGTSPSESTQGPCNKLENEGAFPVIPQKQQPPRRLQDKEAFAEISQKQQPHLSESASDHMDNVENDDDHVSPSSTGKDSDPIYENTRRMALKYQPKDDVHGRNDPDAVFAHALGKKPQNEIDDPDIPYKPVRDKDKKNNTYMEMKPIPPLQSLSHDFSFTQKIGIFYKSGIVSSNTEESPIET